MTQVPLDAEAFFGTFRAYHESFMVAPFIWIGLALAMLYLAVRPQGRSDRMISLFLAAIWAWAGIAYHLLSHAPVNPAARIFAGLFVAQAVLFLHAGSVQHRLTFGPKRDAYGVVGGVLIGYALIVYPVVALLLGHLFPATPTFGVPCPTTLFTFGILLWTSGRVPGWLLVIPLIWALIGSTAALNWGVWQDLAMPAGAIAATAMLVARNRKNPVSDAERAEQEQLAALAGVG